MGLKKQPGTAAYQVRKVYERVFNRTVKCSKGGRPNIPVNKMLQDLEDLLIANYVPFSTSTKSRRLLGQNPMGTKFQMEKLVGDLNEEIERLQSLVDNQEQPTSAKHLLLVLLQRCGDLVRKHSNPHLPIKGYTVDSAGVDSITLELAHTLHRQSRTLHALMDVLGNDS